VAARQRPECAGREGLIYPPAAHGSLQDCGYTPEAAAKEAAKYSGHSGRVGMYTAASEAGVDIDAVAALARHKSLNVAQKYARNADQLKRAPSKNPALAI
jgi:hypothetical protein